jgi:DNA-binding response OmpR family regulator
MAFSLKADDYMVKPFSPRDLVSRVNAAMRRRVEMFAHTNE